jgi:hypothetical protein
MQSYDIAMHNFRIYIDLRRFRLSGKFLWNMLDAMTKKAGGAGRHSLQIEISPVAKEILHNVWQQTGMARKTFTERLFHWYATRPQEHRDTILMEMMKIPPESVNNNNRNTYKVRKPKLDIG